MIENITLGEIAVAIAFLVALFGGLAKALEPLKKFTHRMNKVEEHQDNDNERLNKLEMDTKQILLAVNALLGHAMDNNHNDEIASQKKKLDEYLIQR